MSSVNRDLTVPLTAQQAKRADSSLPALRNVVLAQRVAQLEQNSGGTLAADVAQLQSDMTAVEGDVSTLQSDMTTAQADISALQSGGGGGGGGLLQVGVANIFQQPTLYAAGNVISYRDLSRPGARQWQIGFVNNYNDPFPGGVIPGNLQLKFVLSSAPGEPGDQYYFNALLAQIWADPQAVFGQETYEQIQDDLPFITAVLSNNQQEIFIYPTNAVNGTVVYDAPSIHNVTFSDNLLYGYKFANFSTPPTVTSLSSNMAVFDLPFDFYSNPELYGSLYIPFSFEPTTVSVDVFRAGSGYFKKINTELLSYYETNSATSQLYINAITSNPSFDSKNISASVSIGTAETKSILLPFDSAGSSSQYSLESIVVHSVVGYVDRILGAGGSITVNSIKLCKIDYSDTFSELYTFTLSPGDESIGLEAVANQAKAWQFNATMSSISGVKLLFIKIEVTSAGLAAPNDLMFTAKWDVRPSNCVARVIATANNV